MAAAGALKSAIDPRIERSRRVILAAALDELGELGYGGFTIESVASRAGVGKSTIYRLWPDRLALIADAFGLLHESAAPDLSSGSMRDKLERILRHVAEVVADSPFGACLPALLGAIFFRRLMTAKPFDPAQAGALIDTVMGFKEA